MTMDEYLSALASGLSQLSEEEQRKQIGYYEELFADMKEDGLTEEEIAEKLGSPTKAAREIMEEMPLTKLVKTRVRPKNGWSVLAIILVILGSPIWLSIALAMFAVMISIYVVIWSVVIVLFAVVLSILAAGVAGVALFTVNIMLAPIPALLVFGLGLICLGLTIPAFLGAVAVAKLICKLTGYLAKGVRSLFIRKEGIE